MEWFPKHFPKCIYIDIFDGYMLLCVKKWIKDIKPLHYISMAVASSFTITSLLIQYVIILFIQFIIYVGPLHMWGYLGPSWHEFLLLYGSIGGWVEVWSFHSDVECVHYYFSQMIMNCPPIVSYPDTLYKWLLCQLLFPTKLKKHSITYQLLNKMCTPSLYLCVFQDMRKMLTQGLVRS